MTDPDGADRVGAPSDPSSAYARPEGVAGGFAPHEPLPAPPLVRAAVPPQVAVEFAAPAGSGPGTAFAPAPGDRIAPRRQAMPAAAPALRAAFDRSEKTDAPFEPVPGTRLTPTAHRAQSPWWKEDAAVDPWRDPASSFWLGPPARYVDQHPIAPLDGEPEPEPELESEDEKPAATIVRGRFGRSALLIILVGTLIAGLLGGGVGYWLTKHTDQSLHDPDVTLAKAGSPANRAPGSVADIAKRVAPSVVEIDVASNDETGTGSGVVVSSSNGGGYIVTNNHVVSGVAQGGSIRVVFSDESASVARIVGRDPASDLAVLKVTHSPLTVAALGDSSGLAVGDPVVAIGSPLGLQGTVTTGIVSALDRPVHVSGEGSDTDAVIDAIQTDAAINPGNSGGALVGANGTVIGINSAIASLGSNGTGQSGSIGLGFAIPINTVRTIATQLIRTGTVVHASLGASTRSVTDGNRLGAYILQIDPGGAAAKAGLKEGDVVKLVDGKLITSADQLTVVVQAHQPGDVVTVRYIRGSAEANAKVSLGRG